MHFILMFCFLRCSYWVAEGQETDGTQAEEQVTGVSMDRTCETVTDEGGGRVTELDTPGYDGKMPEPVEEKISFDNKKIMNSSKNCTSLNNSLENTNKTKNSFKNTEGKNSKKTKIKDIDYRNKDKLTEVETPWFFGGLLAKMGGEVTKATPLQECSPLTNRGTDEHGRQVAGVGMHVSCESVDNQGGGDKWLK